MNKELSKKVAKFKMDYHKLHICRLTDECHSCKECNYNVNEWDMIELAKEIIDEFVKGSVNVENL